MATKVNKSQKKELPILAKRIRLLRLGKKLTQEQFGKQFGIVKATVSSYETGNSVPDDDIKKEICKYFNVSADYLLGISDYPTKQPTTKEDIKVALFGGDEPVSDENWNKVKEFVAFLKSYNSNEYAEFLKNYKPKSTHSKENKMINYEKFAIRFRIVLRAKELYFRQKEKEYKSSMPSVSSNYISVGLNGEISSSDISLFVDGRKKPTIKQVDMLANFLSVDYAWLAGENDTAPSWFESLPLSLNDKNELGISNEDVITLYSAAQSQDNHPDKYIQKDNDSWAIIENAPENDDPLV